MNAIAGEVRVGARLRAGRLEAIEVASHRPAPARLLPGKTPAQALELIGRVHAICTRAQGAAARAALQAACGTPAIAADDAAVAAEALRELLVAVFDGQRLPVLAAAVRAIGEPTRLRDVLERQALGCDLVQVLQADTESSLAALAAASDAPLALALRGRLAAREPVPAAYRLLPTAVDEVLAGLPSPLTAGDCARPLWLGAPAATGPLARAAGQPTLAALSHRPLLQLWWARVREVAAAACGQPGTDDAASACGTVSSRALAPGIGRGAAMTARGLLLHEARLHGGRVQHYAILAPTEWNFHPSGPLRTWLEGAGVSSGDEARALVRACATALDPCVPCQVTIRA